MYKILLSSVVFLSFSSLANAQFSKGSILLGGSIYYSNSKSTFDLVNNSEQKNSGANFNVSIGKAYKENSVFGLNLSYGGSSQNNYSDFPNGLQSYRINGYGIGGFYRQYKGLGKDFFLFGEIAATYQWSDQTQKDSTGNKLGTSTTNGGFASFALGISYKVSNKILLELSLPSLFSVGYNSTKNTNQAVTGSSTNDQFNISTSLSTSPLNELAIGFRLIL
jgi:hypothetical protein